MDTANHGAKTANQCVLKLLACHHVLYFSYILKYKRIVFLPSLLAGTCIKFLYHMLLFALKQC
jgi:mannitol-specific phosphotransferase system IIBC component